MDNKISAAPASEIRSVPLSWNKTDIPYPLHKTLHQLFEEQANKTPDAIAVSFKNQTLSYKELNTYANKLALYLQNKGIGKESIVGVCFERSLEMVISLYAVLKAGAAYVPIDPDYPKERRLFMLEDSAVPVVLTHDKCMAKIPENKDIVIYDISNSDINALPELNCGSVSEPENAAYVIYTSGSTGTPKGAINTHRGIVNRLLWMQDCFQLTPNDRVLQKTPYSFDVSVWEFFWPLISGAQLVIAEPGEHRNADYIVRTIKQNNITTLHFVPSMLRLFLEAENVESLSSLKRVICSGETLPYALQERFFSRLSCSLFNLYGPTEAAVDVTWWECRRNDERKIVPIGKPISNIQIHILDESKQHVPIGETGELYIGGVGVARGYLNRPELTNERFIPDPFSEKTGAKLYKTGDLCRYLPDGAIEYLGRIDDQVKIRGFRVELGEIEAAILNNKSIRAVTVTVKEDPLTGNSRLIAYVISDDDTLLIDELRTKLSISLPEYMVPSHFVKMKSFPLTQSGKVNKRALPEPPALRPNLHQIYVSPVTEKEKSVADLWASHLNLDKVGLHDNFFDLGGNSILATALIEAIGKNFNIPLSVISLFQFPTIAALVNHINTDGSSMSGIAAETQDRINKQRSMLSNQKWLKKKQANNGHNNV